MEQRKIGFLEKYNKDAQRIEKSSMNLQMLLALLVAFLWVFLAKLVIPDLSDRIYITVLITLLSYSAAPKTAVKLTKKE